MILANLTGQPLVASLPTLDAGSEVLTLDEHSAGAALLEPEVFLARRGERVGSSSSPMEVLLGPCALARIDIEEATPP
jgi:hypothetical protein